MSHVLMLVLNQDSSLIRTLHKSHIQNQYHYNSNKMMTILTVIFDKTSIAEQITASDLKRISSSARNQLYHIAISECILYMNIGHHWNSDRLSFISENMLVHCNVTTLI